MEKWGKKEVMDNALAYLVPPSVRQQMKNGMLVCPACKQEWLRLTESGVCIECANKGARKVEAKAKTDSLEDKITKYIKSCKLMERLSKDAPEWGK